MYTQNSVFVKQLTLYSAIIDLAGCQVFIDRNSNLTAKDFIFADTLFHKFLIFMLLFLKVLSSHLKFKHVQTFPTTNTLAKF